MTPTTEEEVARLKAKMKGKVAPPLEDIEKTDEEVRRLQQKSVDGTVSVVTRIVEQPAVQNVLKKNINKQTFISGIFMAFIFMGVFQIAAVAKTLIQYNWQGDLILGIVLIAIGLAYIVREMRPVKETRKS